MAGLPGLRQLLKSLLAGFKAHEKWSRFSATPDAGLPDGDVLQGRPVVAGNVRAMTQTLRGGKAQVELWHSGNKPQPRRQLFAAQVDAETIYAFWDECATVWELKRDKMFDSTRATLVAAEQEGRTSFLMEIAPQYLAVILQRTADSGMTPKMVYGDV